MVFSISAVRKRDLWRQGISGMRILALLIVLVPSVAIRGAEVDFSHEIVPLLKTHCGKCHSGAKQEGGFSINSRESLLKGGESGPLVLPGKSKESELVVRISSREDGLRMPPEGELLTEKQIALVSKWIDEGAKWEAGFTFGPKVYEPPLKPRRPDLPPAMAGRDHPIDRILDASFAGQNRQPPDLLDDAAFLRRASLDLIGLLPTPEERVSFLSEPAPDKRSRLVRALLDRDLDYAEHWLTFWNDLLRNDYAGTGFITGGRKQISGWLYDALVMNKPYDQFARDLIAPQNAGQFRIRRGHPLARGSQRGANRGDPICAKRRASLFGHQLEMCFVPRQFH